MSRRVLVLAASGDVENRDGSAFCIVCIAFVAVTVLGSPVMSGRERTTKPTPAAKLNPINATRDLLIFIKPPENGIILQV